MAEIAVGRPCPADGTLTACSGAYIDELLHGQCGCCGKSVSTPNPSWQNPQNSVPAGYRLVPEDWVVEPQSVTPVEPQAAAPEEQQAPAQQQAPEPVTDPTGS